MVCLFIGHVYSVVQEDVKRGNNISHATATGWRHLYLIRVQTHDQMASICYKLRYVIKHIKKQINKAYT